MENNNQQVTPPPAAAPVNSVPECRKSCDARTFWIALLTSVIVVALYHFGGGLYRIWCGEYDPDGGCFRGKQKRMYKVVPLMCPVMMQHCPAAARMCCPMKASFRGEKVRRPHWNREENRKGRRAGFHKKGEHPSAGHHPGKHHYRKHRHPGKTVPERVERNPLSE